MKRILLTGIVAISALMITPTHAVIFTKLIDGEFKSKEINSSPENLPERIDELKTLLDNQQTNPDLFEWSAARFELTLLNAAIGKRYYETDNNTEKN